MAKQPPSSLLEAKLLCAPTVDNVSAISACEAAARECGFLVAARTKRSMLLMPSPRRATLACLAPGFSSGRRSNAAGHGIKAELVPSDDGESLAVAVATPSGTKKGRAFITALTTHLTRLASRLAQKQPARIERGPSNTTHFKSELSAYYYFSKLLLNEKDPPGMAATQFVQRFQDTYKGVSPTAVEQGRPMRECLAALDQLSKLIQEQLANMNPDALANVVELEPWLRTSVERCIFARVGQTLWQLYDGRHSAEDAQYAEKAWALSKVPDEILFEELGVRQEFRVLSDPWSQESPRGFHAPSSASLGAESPTIATMDESTAAGSDEEVSPGPVGRVSFGGPFERAAAALSQIEVSLLRKSGRHCSPREVVEALTFSQFEMKTCALEASGCQMELTAMDDIMPLFVFILLRSSLSKPFACARFMSDALSKDESFESEGRAVLLLESAARHIAYDWDISKISPTSPQGYRVTSSPVSPTSPQGYGVTPSPVLLAEEHPPSAEFTGNLQTSSYDVALPSEDRVEEEKEEDEVENSPREPFLAS